MTQQSLHEQVVLDGLDGVVLVLVPVAEEDGFVGILAGGIAGRLPAGAATTAGGGGLVILVAVVGSSHLLGNDAVVGGKVVGRLVLMSVGVLVHVRQEKIDASLVGEVVGQILGQCPAQIILVDGGGIVGDKVHGLHLEGADVPFPQLGYGLDGGEAGIAQTDLRAAVARQFGEGEQTNVDGGGEDGDGMARTAQQVDGREEAGVVGVEDDDALLLAGVKFF